MRPENSEAHNNLARLLTLQKKFSEAATEFDRALTLQPNAVAALSGLAWVRSVASDPDVRKPEEAIRLAERAADLSGRKDPAILDALAACYASAQQFDRAIATAGEAMQAADAAGMQALWVEIRERLKLYEPHTPYIIR